MIGVVDYDLQRATTVKLHPPNLEIMKLATYYKVEENTFCRLIDLNETELSGYDKIYFFSESEEPITVPAQFLRTNNVIFGGTAFTNGIYQPFENEIIDFTIPRPLIYKDFLKQKYNDGIKSNVIEHILDDSYYRHYAGKNKLPLVSMRAKHRVFLYDIDFFQDGWEDLVDEITARKVSKITCIHPIICNTLTQYFKLREKPKVARDNPVLLELDIPLNDLNYMFKKYANLFLADITKTSLVFLTLGGTFKSRYQYYNDLIYKLNLLYSFWAYSIPIKIKYRYPHTGVIDPLQNLSLAIERWTNGITMYEKTINERIVRKSKKEKSAAHEERDLLLKIKPEAADLFNQTYILISDRRFWRL